MKQVITVVGIAVIIMLVSLAILSVESRSDREEELTRAVSAAVKQAVSHSQVKEQKEIHSDDELIAQFINLLSTNINSDGSLEIEVLDVDYKNGMLDVSVTEKFQYPNGKEAEISVRKCAIYE